MWNHHSIPNHLFFSDLSESIEFSVIEGTFPSLIIHTWSETKGINSKYHRPSDWLTLIMTSLERSPRVYSLGTCGINSVHTVNKQFYCHMMALNQWAVAVSAAEILIVISKSFWIQSLMLHFKLSLPQGHKRVYLEWNVRYSDTLNLWKRSSPWLRWTKK